MSKSTLNKPVALAIGAAFASSLAVTSVAAAATFALAAPGQAQVLAAEDSGGGDKGKEGACGEGKCGGDMKGKGAAGGGDKGKGKDKGKEGACGEGKCGGDMKPADPPK